MTDDKTTVAEAVEERLVDEVVERLMDRVDASGRRCSVKVGC